MPSRTLFIKSLQFIEHYTKPISISQRRSYKLDCSHITLQKGVVTMDTDEKSSAQVIKEGRAEIFSPAHVFYNPVQEFNRDLTIAVISEHVKDHFKNLREHQAKKTLEQQDCLEMKEGGPGLNDPVEAGIKYDNGVKILEALAASGLRSVRFALEVAGVREIVANDFDEQAVNFIQKNIIHNTVDGLVRPSLSDASMIMYQNSKFSDRFDVIDLDPYGSASPFLDGAVQALKDGGLLCVTCTDMAVLAGNAPETCYSKYQAVSLRTKFCHEQGLRILLQCIESHANRYSRYIVPLLSISADFYIRIFVRLYTGQSQVKHSVSKLSLFYHCVGCGNFTLQPLIEKIQTSKDNYKFSPAHGPTVKHECDICGSRQTLGGPVWSAPIHDMQFVQRVAERVEKYKEGFGTSERLRGVLTVITEELPHVPFYYINDELSKTLHCNALRMIDLRSAILHAGYEVSFSHCHKNSVKTSAPMDVIWDIYRCWVRQHPVSESRLKDGSPVKVILSKKPSIEAVFDEHPLANPLSRKLGLLRWQQNPSKDWGPKARATRGDGSSLEKRRKRGLEKAKQKKRKAVKELIDYKQFACKRHKEGCCKMGDKCRYSHDTDGNNAEHSDHRNSNHNSSSHGDVS